jgi:hypothetical protein
MYGVEWCRSQNTYILHTDRYMYLLVKGIELAKGIQCEKVRRGRDVMVVGFKTTYAISVYHH